MNLYQLASVQAHVELHLKLPRVYEFLLAHTTDGGLCHPTTSFKLIELWNTLVSVRPQSVVEIGCGATTCVFALYAKQYGARVVTTEDKPEYMEACKRRLGELTDHIYFQEKRLIGDREPCYFLQQDFGQLDLLYVDGPANPKNEVCADAKNLVAGGTRVGLIMFDFRYPTVRDFSERYGGNYRIEQACQIHKDSWYLSGLRHHSFAWRRN